MTTDTNMSAVTKAFYAVMTLVIALATGAVVALSPISSPAIAHADGGLEDWGDWGEPYYPEDDWGDWGEPYYEDDWGDWGGCDWDCYDDGYYLDDLDDCYYYGGCGGYYDDGYGYYDDCYFDCGGYDDYYWDYEYEYEYEYDYWYEYEDDDDDHDDDEPTCDIDADDTSIEEGDSTKLRWDSDDADDAHINQGIGDVSLSGSRTVSPDEDTTYKLTVRDNDGDTDTCSVTIRVEEEDEDDELSCELDVDDRSVEEGDEVTLEWEIDGDADYASINQGVGRVDEDGGEEEVEIEDDEDVTFRLTVRNDDDEDTCSVTVRVDDENTFSSIDFDPGPVTNPPVVYLSNLPYTGIEDITPSMVGFYAALAALLGLGAYYVFIRRRTA